MLRKFLIIGLVALLTGFIAPNLSITQGAPSNIIAGGGNDPGGG